MDATGDDARVRRRVKLSLPMEPDFELVATETASVVAQLVGLSEDAIDELRMAVIEACINAFEHSKSNDGKVDVTIEDREDRIVIVIEDRGEGFDYDPKAVAPRTVAGGRKRGFGLRIIQEMMDDVKVETSESGTRIIMVKLVPGKGAS